MALRTIKLPVCDACGEPWLPEPGPARDNPRKYDRERRKAGLPPMRCGKCKSPQWDIQFRGDLRKQPHKRVVVRKPVKVAAGNGILLRRCSHGLLNCPTCNNRERKPAR